MKNKKLETNSEYFYRIGLSSNFLFSKSFFLILCFLFLIGSIGFSQNKLHVSGLVQNDKGVPLAGVSVNVQEKTTGATTSKDGLFSLDVPSSNSILVISYIGFSTKKLLVGSTSYFSVTLVPEDSKLDEVVVVGYGTQKKTSLTSSIATIKGQDMAAQPVANLSNSLGGRAAGIIFTQGSGEPGYDGSNILIRGIGTTGNTQPLVIVDGVPRNFTQLDPNTIASVSILKDAAAVAPYGLGGANGVILITTKKGKSGTPSLTYNGYIGWQNPTVQTKFVNAFQYGSLFNAADDNQGAPHAYSDYALQKYKDHSAPDLYPDHNVLKELENTNTLLTSHNLELSGGGEKIRYFAGVGYLAQDGLWGPTNYKRYSLISNIEADATKTTKVNVSINGRVEDRHFPGVSAGNIFYQAFRTPPTAPLTFSNGLPGSYIGRSAAGNISESGNTQTSGYTLLNQISIEQQLPFIKGLSVKALASYDFNPFSSTDPTNPTAPIISFSRTWLTPINFYAYDSATNTYPKVGNDGPAKPQYSEAYLQSQAFTYQGYINYHNTFGKSDVTGLIVLESRNTKTSIFGGGRVNYNIDVPELNNGSANSTDISNYGYSLQTKQKSAVYRVAYSYDGKYFIEASGRYDGNYYFAPGKRFGFFPAFSAGWRISEEKFIKENASWITNLKIRGSMGQSGALAGSAFQYLSAYNVIGNASVINNTATQGLVESTQANPNITWERAKKKDIGLEADLWSGLVTAEFDYFYEKRSDMLFAPTITVPSEYGVGLSQVNSGQMSNSGFEITLGTSHRFSNGLRVSMDVNYTYAKNKLLQVFETAATYNNPNRRITGRPLNTRFGYKALGYYTSADFDANGHLLAGEATQPWGQVHPGDLKYADLSGADGKPDGKITPDDMVPIGQSYTPQIIYGFSPSVSYKGFDLTLLFQGAAKRNFYQSVYAFDNSSSATIDALDYWTPNNLNAEYPRITTQPTSNNTQGSSWWIRNGSYLRLKTGQLGYTLPASVIKNLHLQVIRFYVSGQNMLTFSHIKNFDPEISASNGQYYPQQKVVSVGLSVTF
jgi:TonB-linked SusC/RagA family outer membrane protein